jgi:hypothetical protein
MSYAKVMESYRLPKGASVGSRGTDGRLPSSLVLDIRVGVLHAQAVYNDQAELGDARCGNTAQLVSLSDNTSSGVNVLYCLDASIQAAVHGSMHPNVTTFTDTLFGVVEPVSEQVHSRKLPVAITSFASISPVQRGAPCLVCVLAHTDLGARPQEAMWTCLVQRLAASCKEVMPPEQVRGEALVRVLGRHTADMGREQMCGWMVFFRWWVASECYTHLQRSHVALPHRESATWAECKEVLLLFMCDARRSSREADGECSAARLLDEYAIFLFVDAYHAGNGLHTQTVTIASRTRAAVSSAQPTLVGCANPSPSPKRTKLDLESMDLGLRHLLGRLGFAARDLRTRDYRRLKEYVMCIADILRADGTLSVRLHQSSLRGGGSSPLSVVAQVQIGAKDLGGHTQSGSVDPESPRCCSAEIADVEQLRAEAAKEEEEASKKLSYYGPVCGVVGGIAVWLAWPNRVAGGLQGCEEAEEEADSSHGGVREERAAPALNQLPLPHIFVNPVWLVNTMAPGFTHQRPEHVIRLPATICRGTEVGAASIRVCAADKAQRLHMNEIQRYIVNHLMPRLAEQAYGCHWSASRPSGLAGVSAPSESHGDATQPAIVQPNRRLAVKSSYHETVNHCWRNKWLLSLPGDAVARIGKGVGIHFEFFTSFVLGRIGGAQQSIGLLQQLATKSLLDLCTLPRHFRGPTDLSQRCEDATEPGLPGPCTVAAFDILDFGTNITDAAAAAQFEAVKPLIVYRKGKASSISGRTSWANGDSSMSRQHLRRALRVSVLRIFVTAVENTQQRGDSSSLVPALRVCRGCTAAALVDYLKHLHTNVAFLHGAPPSSKLSAKRLQSKLNLEDEAEPSPAVTFMLDVLTVALSSGLARQQCLRAPENGPAFGSLRCVHQQACDALARWGHPLSCCTSGTCGFSEPATPTRPSPSPAHAPMPPLPQEDALTSGLRNAYTMRTGKSLVLRPGQHSVLHELRAGRSAFALMPCGTGKTFMATLHTMLQQSECTASEQTVSSHSTKRLILLCGPTTVALRRVVAAATSMGLRAQFAVDVGQQTLHRLMDGQPCGEVLLLCFTPEKLAGDAGFRAAIDRAATAGSIAAWYIDEADLLLQLFRREGSLCVCTLAAEVAAKGTPLCLMSGTMSSKSKQDLSERLGFGQTNSTAALPTTVMDADYTKDMLQRVNWMVVPRNIPGGGPNPPKFAQGDDLHPAFAQICRIVMQYTRRSERILVYAPTVKACEAIERQLKCAGVKYESCYTGRVGARTEHENEEAVSRFLSTATDASLVMVCTNPKLARALDSGPVWICAVLDTGGLEDLESVVQHGMRLTVCRRGPGTEAETVAPPPHVGRRGDHILLYDWHDVVWSMQRSGTENRVSLHELRCYAELHSSCRIRCLGQHIGLPCDENPCWCDEGAECQVCRRWSDAGMTPSLEPVSVTANSVVEYATTPGVDITHAQMVEVLLGSRSKDLLRRLAGVDSRSCYGPLQLRTPKRNASRSFSVGLTPFAFDGCVATSLAGELTNILLAKEGLTMRKVDLKHAPAFYLSGGMRTRELLEGHMTIELTFWEVSGPRSTPRETTARLMECVDIDCLSFAAGTRMSWKALSMRHRTESRLVLVSARAVVLYCCIVCCSCRVLYFLITGPSPM